MARHVLHKLLIEIDNLEDKKQYNSLSGQISSLSKTTLSSRIDKLLEQYHISGYNIVIDELEVDLGEISIKNFEYELLSRVEKALRKKLASINIVAKAAISQGKGFQKSHKLTLKEIEGLGRISLLQNDKEVLENAFVNANNFSENYSSGNGNVNSQNKDQTEYVKSPIIADIQLSSNRYFEAIVFYLINGWMPYFLYIPRELFNKILIKTIEENKRRLLDFISKKPVQQQLRIQTRLKQLIIYDNKKTNNLLSHPDFILINKLISEAEQISRDQSDNKTRPVRTETIPHLPAEFILNNIASNYTDIKPDNLNLLSRALIYFFIHGKKYPNLPYYINDNREIINQLYQRAPRLLKDILELVPDLLPNVSTRQRRIKQLFSELNKVEVENLLKTFFSFSNKWKKTLNKLNELYTVNSVNIPRWLKDVEDTKIAQAEFLYVAMSNKVPDDKELQNKVSKIIRRVEKDLAKLFVQSLTKEFPFIVVKGNFTIDNIRILLQAFGTLKPEDSNQFTENDIKKILENQSLTFTKISTENFIIKFQKILNRFAKKIKVTNSLRSNISRIRQYHLTQESMSILTKAIQEEIKPTISNQNSETKKEKDNIESVKEKFKHLLLDYYIPLDGGNSITLLEIVTKLSEQMDDQDKSAIVDKLDQKKILNNPFLKRLDKIKFEKTLASLLPTDRYRSFLYYRDVYKTIWRKFFDAETINLIFLSLVKENKNIQDKDIFVHFIKAGQKLKGWNSSVYKDKSRQLFSDHKEKMSNSQKETFSKFHKELPSNTDLNLKAKSTALSQGIAVKNAGLVLIWPFYKTLFQLTGLLDKEGNFIDKEAKERAVFLLQYLAVKQSSGDEPYLVLNKILVGFPLEDPIANEITMTNKEKDICDALLLNVIKQWKGLGQSSADNLRGSFLIRDGVLNLQAVNWHLKVEKKAFDLLLGKLPWSYSMIKISWLPYLIKVDWD